MAKVFAENSAISVADKVLVHFTAHFENGKKFLQKAVELDEKAKGVLFCLKSDPITAVSFFF